MSQRVPRISLIPRGLPQGFLFHNSSEGR